MVDLWTTCAALRKESRMQILKATGLDRKSGGAQAERSLCGCSVLEMFSTERARISYFAPINTAVIVTSSRLSYGFRREIAEPYKLTWK